MYTQSSLHRTLNLAHQLPFPALALRVWTSKKISNHGNLLNYIIHVTLNTEFDTLWFSPVFAKTIDLAQTLCILAKSSFLGEPPSLIRTLSKVKCFGLFNRVKQTALALFYIKCASDKYFSDRIFS